MSTTDWIVLIVTLALIILYGVFKGKASKNLEGYFLSDRQLPWWVILLSIMGTQASAITFLSAPGQAFTDGMRFVQYYFGLPLAMVVICITFVPIFHRLRVFTAYEYLEGRFDPKTRTLTSILFLLQRGISTGLSVYAPALILSSLLGWNIYWTNIIMGGLVIIYTVSGGARAVAYTQQLQFVIIFASLFIAAAMVIHLLPEGVGLVDALQVSGRMGKLNVITTGMESGKGFDWSDRYNMLSGVIGGFFLSLSYFGTDQSQVGRYLTAKTTRESRMGLLMNGLVKVPMQFFILLIGALVFTFYQFHPAPFFFNSAQVERVRASSYADSLRVLETEYGRYDQAKTKAAAALFDGKEGDEQAYQELGRINQQRDSLRSEFRSAVNRKGIGGDNNDTNYIFLGFVIGHLPKGLIGLLIAMIFLAAWGSIAAALNSLASSTVVDIHKRYVNRKMNESQDYQVSRRYTFVWGLFCIVVAQFAHNIGNSLIEAVNILGSIFYGVILGIFLVAFYLKGIRAGAVFWSALIVQCYILLSFGWPWILGKLPFLEKLLPSYFHSVLQAASTIGFLWLNVVGAAAVILLAVLFNTLGALRRNK